MNLRAAAAELKIPKSTAYDWKKKYEEGSDIFSRKEGSGRPKGRPAILNEEHQKYLVEMIDENPSLVLDQMMDSLTSQFEDLKVSKTTLYDFIKKKSWSKKGERAIVTVPKIKASSITILGAVASYGVVNIST
ncbi:hypothetical protein G6F56_005120 [Rhizopus delemar]|nr:hypothetical protein G6F56_005120 [Rhizopus delemar]